ncbi:hypothetical protein TNCV_3913341 [Trichonephila clavipes]|nr:hypothetical protein TNCV_3913341 [Trichonephila clavipes]
MPAMIRYLDHWATAALWRERERRTLKQLTLWSEKIPLLIIPHHTQRHPYTVNLQWYWIHESEGDIELKCEKNGSP